MPRWPVKGLTERQAETLEWIRRYIQEHGIPPTLPEIAEGFGIRVSSVFDLLTGLEKRGYLDRSRGPRSMRITSPGGTGRRRRAKMPAVENGALSVPIVGRAAAGHPIFAEENVVGHVRVDALLARGRCYAMTVVDDSMVGAGIMDGDLIIVRQQQVAENGDVVVVTLNGDRATVKRLFIDDDRIELRPENDKYDPIPIGPDDDLQIAGKVVGVRPVKGKKGG